MGDPKDFIEVIESHFESKKSKNPRYSWRSFALSVGVDSSRLSKMLKRQRPMHPSLVASIGEKLGLSQKEILSFQETEEKRYRRKTTSPMRKRKMVFKPIALNIYEIISDVHHYHILELMKTDDFNPDYKWIAQRIGATESETLACIKRLQDVGLLTVDNEGQWADTTEGASTDIISEVEVSKAHTRQMKEITRLSLAAIDDYPKTERDHSAIMFASSKSRMLEAKQMIKAFRHKLCQFMEESPEKDTVYELSVALFPLSKELK